MFIIVRSGRFGNAVKKPAQAGAGRCSSKQALANRRAGEKAHPAGFPRSCRAKPGRQDAEAALSGILRRMRLAHAGLCPGRPAARRRAASPFALSGHKVAPPAMKRAAQFYEGGRHLHAFLRIVFSTGPRGRPMKSL